MQLKTSPNLGEVSLVLFTDVRLFVHPGSMVSAADAAEDFSKLRFGFRHQSISLSSFKLYFLLQPHVLLSWLHLWVSSFELLVYLKLVLVPADLALAERPDFDLGRRDLPLKVECVLPQLHELHQRGHCMCSLLSCNELMPSLLSPHLEVCCTLRALSAVVVPWFHSQIHAVHHPGRGDHKQLFDPRARDPGLHRRPSHARRRQVFHPLLLPNLIFVFPPSSFVAVLHDRSVPQLV